jgi:hypothetical protein
MRFNYLTYKNSIVDIPNDFICIREIIYIYIYIYINYKSLFYRYLEKIDYLSLHMKLHLLSMI